MNFRLRVLSVIVFALAACAKADAPPAGNTQGAGSSGGAASGASSSGGTTSGSSGGSSGSSGFPSCNWDAGGVDGGCVDCGGVCCDGICVQGADACCPIPDGGPVAQADGGARTGLSCGDGGLVCNDIEFCTEGVVSGPGMFRQSWSCVAIPSCNADPTCDCFALDSGLGCRSQGALGLPISCAVDDGVVTCTESSP